MSAPALIALGGNPNTGKSTIFNGLTGLRQHTGNWPGKTVLQARGSYQYLGRQFEVVDLPGTYSLTANSAEEEVARDFLAHGNVDAVVIVVDITCLERHLNLVLQVLALHSQVIVCANFMDEAKRKNLRVDLFQLEQELGVPVIPTIGTTKEGLPELKDAVARVINGQLDPKPRVQTNLDTAEIFQLAENITAKVAFARPMANPSRSERLDSIVTSRFWGIPIMLLLLSFAFWLTITGANYPSELLTVLFHKLGNWLQGVLNLLPVPPWLSHLLVDGIYSALSWVVAVMLPPMAIFFPLFTLLEDFGYLPRVAFNLDHLFQRAGTQGKQALTMSMGFGCNAAGIISCRIIESPRDRTIAILTNNFMPCNGRFPLLIVMGTLVAGLAFHGNYANIVPTLAVLGGIILAVTATFLVSKLLTSTIYKGESSFFILELPPFRRPLFGQVLYRSLIDRTLFVLGRAVLVAAPAGLFIWILANTQVGGITLISHLTLWLDPLGKAIGLDGVILLSFLLGLPANEIVIPIMLMIYLNASSLLALESIGSLQTLLVSNGWSVITALNFVIFSIFHWPCGTTLLTIKKETNSWKQVFLSAVIPTVIGIVLCFLTAAISRVIN